MKDQKYHSDLRLLIASALIRLREITRLNYIQNQDYILSPFYNALVTEYILHLDFILSESSKPPINQTSIFEDDIIPYSPNRNKGYKNVTELIKYFRNVVCHSEVQSFIETFDKKQKIRSIFQTTRSQIDHKWQKPVCIYDDDIALLAGDHKLYIRRHLIKAFNEIYEKLLSLDEFAPYKTLIGFKEKSGR